MANAEVYADTVSTLTEIGASIAAQDELDKILANIAQKGGKGTQSPVVLIETWQANQSAKPMIRAAYGIGQTTITSLADFSPFCKKSYSEKNAVFIRDYYLETEGAVPSFARVQAIKTLVAFPMVWGDQTMGALYFFRAKKTPFSKEEKSFASVLAIQAAIAIQQTELILERQSGYTRTIKILADIMDRKDSYTHGHSFRVMEYALMITDRMGIGGRERQEIGDGGYLHDLGKINVDITILQKPGKLTPQEWERMILHPDVGAEIVSETGVLRELAPIIRHHHEMYAGGGYPDGLSRDQIPIGSRIVSVADAYEAMVSDRPYRKGMSPESAIQELRRHAGTQFDPEVVALFVELI